MAPIATTSLRFCGREVAEQQLELMESLTRRYPNLSRTELAATTCELLGWARPNGRLKTVECREFLEGLEERQRITLPPQRKKRPKKTAVAIHRVEKMAPIPIRATLKELQPISLQLVATPDQRNQWRSLVDQHHYLGHKIPFGAHLRYLIQSTHGTLGCLQYSSPAWRLESRDRWIGWNDVQRKQHLQHILCNSRFLVLPWVQVANLASHLLARAAKQVATDWFDHYQVEPWLLESLVDARRFSGTCYRAANWIEAGMTRGRGRDDRYHQRHGSAPKRVWLYPLHATGRRRFCQGV
jgi:hypothetical protein